MPRIPSREELAELVRPALSGWPLGTRGYDSDHWRSLRIAETVLQHVTVEETVAEMLAREAAEAERISEAEERGYAAGVQRVLDELQAMGDDYRAVDDPSGPVWSQGDFLLRVVIPRLETRLR